MLELYNREFVKIPTGLFEEHAEFDTSLPAGTRRQEIVDPKRVEFGVFSSSLFSACDIITEFGEVPPVFESLVLEMEARYELLEDAGFSDIRQYNAGVEPDRRRPYIVVVIDEFADLLMQNVEGFEQAIIRLAQKARASGIHLVLATQRPSADVIRGLLKTNIPGRVALSVSSQIDSKIILDMTGAENLTGKGDLICLCPAFRDGIRLQGAYITNNDIHKIIVSSRKYELYNLDNDIKESKNLVEEYPERALRMKETLLNWSKSVSISVTK